MGYLSVSMLYSREPFYFTLGRYVAEEQRKCSVDAVLTYNHSILIHLE